MLLLVLDGARAAGADECPPELLPTVFMLFLTLPTPGVPVLPCRRQLRRLRVLHGVRLSDIGHRG